MVWEGEMDKAYQSPSKHTLLYHWTVCSDNGVNAVRCIDRKVSLHITELFSILAKLTFRKARTLHADSFLEEGA